MLLTTRAGCAGTRESAAGMEGVQARTRGGPKLKPRPAASSPPSARGTSSSKPESLRSSTQPAAGRDSGKLVRSYDISSEMINLSSEVAQTDLLFPLLDRKQSARAAGRLRNGPRDVAVPRTSRNRSPPRSRCAPLFAPLFPPFLGRKAVYDLDILGASRTNFQVRKKSCIHLSHVFAAFRSFYALESLIAEIL